MVKALKSNFFLLKKLIQAEIKLRNDKSFLGFFWYIATPILYGLLYYFALVHVFSARTGQSAGLTNVVVLFWGVSLHSYLSEIIMKSINLIRVNTNFVKKTVFPLELLCLKDLLAGLVSFTFYLVVCFFALLYLDQTLFSILYLLISTVFFVIACAGICFLLSVLGVFITDLSSVSGLLTSGLLFLSPTLYDINNFPQEFQALFYLNPLTYPVNAMREILSTEKMGFDAVNDLAIYGLITIVLTLVSVYFFHKIKKYFVDVL